MKVKETNYLVKILIFGVMTITLIITPGLNKDSLVIPKVMVFFCLALYLVPTILKSLKGSLANPYIKKLTILVFLNDDFEGGKFYIQNSHERFYPPQSRGTVLVFPSFMPHGVEPITKGIRYSVVTWMVGPYFK